LLAVDARDAFLFAEAAEMLLVTNTATSAKRRTEFTQLDRSIGERRLP
jgi:hypothetical protein